MCEKTFLIRQKFAGGNLKKKRTIAIRNLRFRQIRTELRTLLWLAYGKETDRLLAERKDIYEGYKQLPAADRYLIENAYNEKFNKYGVELRCKVYCQFCKNEDIVSLDLVRQFFRTIY